MACVDPSEFRCRWPPRQALGEARSRRTKREMGVISHDHRPDAMLSEALALMNDHGFPAFPCERARQRRAGQLVAFSPTATGGSTTDSRQKSRN